MNGVFHDAEDVKILANRDPDRLIKRVGRFEPHAIRSPAQPFHCVLPVDGHDDDTSVLRMCRPIHNQQITVQDSRVSHRVAIDPHQERSCFVINQEVGQIEWRFQVVFCWAWEPRRHGSIEVRQH